MKEKDKKLTDIIDGMSLEDKALMLTQYPIDSICGNKEIVTGCWDMDGMTNDMIMRVGTVLNVANGETADRIRAIRKENGIDDPLMFMLDVIHGYRTIFPIPLAMACSFDTELVEECARIAAVEAAADGVDATFSPMVDLARDARWGRVMETAGEDPYLGGEMGKAYIRGYHNGGLACCVKHFAAYGAAEGGRDYDTTDVSERSLNEHYLRAYCECVKEKPEMFMSSFNLLNGKPLLAHPELTVDKLRDEWGFNGVLISDYNAVRELNVHGYAATPRDCALTAFNAELDIEMCSPCYANNLPDLVREGVVDEKSLDEKVYRVLKMKDRCGLYDIDKSTDTQKRDKITLCEEFRAAAKKAEERSCVLLKNDGVLPLKKSANIALVGPFADEKYIFGHWASTGRADDVVTVQQGIERTLGRTVESEKGCSYDLLSDDESGFDAAVRFAQNSDVIVACVGEHMYNSGESHSRADIALPKVQTALLHRLKTLGKPVVLVVFGGRPLALTDVLPLSDAVLYAWQGGTECGSAIASLLYGDAVPSAKTVMSFPRSSGQCPIYYNHFQTGRPRASGKPAVLSGDICTVGYDDEYNDPLFPFGYGLSYTTFDYSDLKLDKAKMRRDGKITATVTVNNTGDRDGTEIVQWYIRDKFASVVRPVKELKGYERVELKAGESKTVRFEITKDTLAFFTDGGAFDAESGDFDLFVGGNSRDCLQTGFALVD